ncbi:ABC transporter ATP-binding protein [Rhodospira trueperi]|uniref:Peptide/nickel transport system ATP-binding protein n=1 Tax=Rhodospira trueperi TaxID=69960 RepID=A0A1G7AN86_9PROT|nr:oligopeptide/dipeptide ABC transporter ATP-binding protein [Rhodospira trueperi]SDE15927.1 peptide/nickel transport system ATP-binding protein [Rhodospira trueperi]
MTPRTTRPDAPLLSVRDLRQSFRVSSGTVFGGRRSVRAVDGISFDVPRGRVLGIVGESGCGKSSVAKSILNIHTPTSGSIRFDGTDLATLDAAGWRALRQDIQYVFQDPLGALDPRMTVLGQVVEPLIIHGLGDAAERRARGGEMLEAVGLTGDMFCTFPHELSGGQRQRVVLARALVLKPRLLICDEPVSALDVSIQAQVIRLLEALKESLDLTIIFISHDLSLVRYVCDDIAVMYLGRIVEHGPTGTVFTRPRHPYTRALMSAIPVPEPDQDHETIILPGEPPSPFNPPPGCRFHPRCSLQEPMCRSTDADLEPMDAPAHAVACHVVHGRGTAA